MGCNKRFWAQRKISRPLQRGLLGGWLTSRGLEVRYRHQLKSWLSTWTLLWKSGKWMVPNKWSSCPRRLQVTQKQMIILMTRLFRLPTSQGAPYLCYTQKYELKCCVAFRSGINHNPLHNEVAISSQIWNFQIWLCRIWDLNIWGGFDCGYGCDPFPTTGDDVDHPDFSSPGISHAHIFGVETTRILRPNSTSNNPTVDLSNFRDIDWTMIWDFQQCKWWLVKLKPF